MKKFLSLVIVFAFSVLLAGCNDIKPINNETTQNPNETNIPTETGEAEETDEPKNNDPQNITVLSNEANLIFKEIVIPDAELKSIFKYNDRYSIVVTGDGKFTAAKNVKLYFIDKSEGKIVAETQLDGKYMPTDIQYTDDGAIIHHPVREIDGFTVSSAYQVKYANNQLEVTAVEIDKFPDRVAKIVSPDGQYTVYGVNDDNRNGGIDIIYPDGSKKRVMEFLTFNEHGLREYSIYTPRCFVDNTRFIYSSSTGIGLYDISTGENITLVVTGEYRGYSDGYVYYYTHRKNYAAFDLWKCNISEEKVQIASVMAVDGLHVLNKYHTYYFMNGMWFAYHNTSLYSAELIDNQSATVSIYSEDMGKKLAALKYPYDSIHWPQLVMASDETVSVIVFDSTETETPETEAPETEAPETDTPETEPAVEVDPASPVTVISNPGGLDINIVLLPISEGGIYTDAVKYDERHMLYITYGDHTTREDGTTLWTDIHFYLIDILEGKIVADTASDINLQCDYTDYTEDGIILFDAEPIGNGEYCVGSALSVKYKNESLIIESIPKENVFPHSKNRVVSPTGEYVVYSTTDDTEGRGGIDVLYAGGAVGRIISNKSFWDAADAGYSGDEALGYAKYYRAEGFADNTHLVYSIGGYEWSYGFGIYDLATGENTEYLSSIYHLSHVGNGFVAFEEVDRESGVPEQYRIWTMTLDGKKTLVASVDEADNVAPIPKYITNRLRNEPVYAFSESSTKEVPDYFDRTVSYRVESLYSADMKELLAVIEYPSDSNQRMVRNIHFCENSVTIILPTKDTAIARLSETEEIGE